MAPNDFYALFRNGLMNKLRRWDKEKNHRVLKSLSRCMLECVYIPLLVSVVS
jgi:hypothetical protein